MIDLEEDSAIVEMFVHKKGRKLLVASQAGNGFVLSEDDVIAQTRKGKQIMTVSAPDKAIACINADGDHVATVGANRKMLIFPLQDVNELSRGRGVRLQTLRNSRLSDITVFKHENGLRWREGPRVRTFTEFEPWIGKRAGAGAAVPKGFPRATRFGLSGL